MDVDALLEQLLDSVNRYMDPEAELSADLAGDYETLAEGLLNLDRWVRMGGYIPKRWAAVGAK